MGTLLTLAVSAYFFVVSYRLQFAYFLFVFLIPFMPKYIGIGVGGEGFALSLQRVLLMILFMYTVISFVQNKEYISQRILQVYQQNQTLINLLLIFFVIKVFSLSINSREIALYIMLFNDFLLSLFVMMLTILVIDSEEAVDRLMKVLFYGYIIVLILVLVESIIKFPPLGKFASAQMSLARDYSEGLTRGGKYRANGSFISPIVLGEYLVILFPMIIAYIFKNKYSLMFKIIFFLLFIYAVYSAGSRSAILMTAAIFYFYLILNLYKGSSFSRFIANLFNLIIISIVLYFTYNYINDLVTNFTGRYDLIVDPEERSSTSRALQYIAVYNVMQEAPLFGFGRERNFLHALEGLTTVDNSFFWIILEVGVIGILVYFLFLFVLAKRAFDQYRSSHINYYLLPLLISTVVSILYHVLSSNSANHIYLYIFAGLICVMKVMQNEKRENTLVIQNIKVDK